MHNDDDDADADDDDANADDDDADANADPVLIVPYVSARVLMVWQQRLQQIPYHSPAL